MIKSIVFLVLFWCAPILAQPPHFVSLKIPFQKFVAKAKDADFEIQLKIWQQEVEGALPDVYSELLSPSSTKTTEQIRREKAAKWFPFFLKNSDAILARFEEFEKSGWSRVQALVANYPRVDFSDVRVIALPSFMSFNGMVNEVGGRSVAMYGIDFVELLSQQPKLIEGSDLITDVPVLVAHEFTHVLHGKVSGFGTDDLSYDRFLGNLWAEGLAQMHSQMLVPGTDLTNVLMDRNIAAKCTSQQVRTWAGEYLLDSHITSDEQMTNQYTKWFNMSGYKQMGVARAGYCLGYHVILESLREHSMLELLRMDRAQAYAIVKKTLQDMRIRDVLRKEYRPLK